jgi:hypothetical protein
MCRSKIKCHAERPSCSSCRKRQLRCAYSQVPDRAQDTAAETSAAHDVEDYENENSVVLVAEIDEIVSGTALGTGLPSPSSGRGVNNNTLPDASSPFGQVGGSVPDYALTVMDSNMLDCFFGEPSMQTNLGWIFDDLPEDGFPSLSNSPRPIFSSVIGLPLAPEIEQVASENRSEELNNIGQEDSNTNIQGAGVSENSWFTEWNVIPAE